jgi:penicillin-binding protein 2
VNWNELNTSLDKPLVNRALFGTYPPGSTFKPFMALAALTFGKRTPQQTISDPGYFNFGGHHFRDDKVGGHGIVDMYKSIVVSCDTYYYVLANDLGIDAIARFMDQLGFGSRTGIDIEGEAAGVLPSQEWKMRRFNQKWFAGETISVGIGQGYNAYTPLQLATAIATIANNGVMFRPHIVNYVEDNRTLERSAIEPNSLRTLDVKKQHLEVIQQALIGVNKEGTSARSFIGAGYVSAGKTGTAQVIALKQGEKYVESSVQERHRDHALFIAYAPADDPKIALAVIVENAGFGARHAAPIARKVLDYYLLGKLPPPERRKDKDASGA